MMAGGGRYIGGGYWRGVIRGRVGGGGGGGGYEWEPVSGEGFEWGTARIAVLCPVRSATAK